MSEVKVTQVSPGNIDTPNFEITEDGIIAPKGYHFYRISNITFNYVVKGKIPVKLVKNLEVRAFPGRKMIVPEGRNHYIIAPPTMEKTITESLRCGRTDYPIFEINPNPRLIFKLAIYGSIAVIFALTVLQHIV